MIVVAFHWLLIAVHAGLALWAAAGLVEFLLPGWPGPALQNPLFPTWLQLLHWLAIAGGAAGFFIPRLFAPRLLVPVLAAAYAAMAVVCAVQTFGYLDHAGRFRDMALEYAAYLAILAFLHRFPPGGTAIRPLGRVRGGG